MTTRTRSLLIGAVLFLIVGAFAVYRIVLSDSILPASLGKEIYVEIPTNSSFEEVIELLKKQGVVRDEVFFRKAADYMGYKRDPMRSGRYELQPGMNIIQVVRVLRGGQQAPVKVILTTERLPEEVAAKVSRFIEPDSNTLLQTFTNPDFLQQIGYTPENLMTIFIPNTYELFWNTNAEGFVERMIKEKNAFWAKNNRLAKAKALGLTPEEVYTVASIVEKETLNNTEKPTIAGVYLNRLAQGMRLQADPTVVFATRDFTTKRVTSVHTQFDSPYNTYRYAGLPPGPISLASISSIDAVLNREDHKYIYFCASGDETGLHNFAETFEQHQGNIALYRRNLEKRGLR
jgi:UPF0755 protein